MEIKDRLKQLLDIYGERPSDMANKTGINRPTLSMYLHGNREPKANMIYLIAQKYNVNEAWLLGYDVPMERQKQFNKQEALDDASIITDPSVRKLALDYLSLPDDKKKLVIDFVSMLKNQ